LIKPPTYFFGGLTLNCDLPGYVNFFHRKVRNERADCIYFRPVVFNLSCTATNYNNSLWPNDPHLKLEWSKCITVG